MGFSRNLDPHEIACQVREMRLLDPPISLNPLLKYLERTQDGPEKAGLEVLKTLRVLNDKSVVPALRAFLEKSKDNGLRAEALRTLSALETPEGK